MYQLPNGTGIYTSPTLRIEPNTNTTMLIRLILIIVYIFFSRCFILEHELILEHHLGKKITGLWKFLHEAEELPSVGICGNERLADLQMTARQVEDRHLKIRKKTPQGNEPIRTPGSTRTASLTDQDVMASWNADATCAICCLLKRCWRCEWRLKISKKVTIHDNPL